MANLDSASGNPVLGIEPLERRLIVLVGRGGVKRCPLVNDPLHRLGAVEVDVLGRGLEREIVAVAENLALTGRRENNELVAQIAADRSGLGAHRNGGEAEA